MTAATAWRRRLGTVLALATGAGFAGGGPPAAAAAPQGAPAFAGRAFVVAGAGSHFPEGADAASIRGEAEPATTAWLGIAVTALARQPDGSILIGTDGVLWRVRADQQLERVMGGRAGTEPWRDGTPALEAPLSDVTGLAVAADGSTLLSDAAAGTVTRIGPDGLARRVATGLCGPGPLLGLPGGALLVGERGCGAVARIGPDGTLGTLVRGASLTPPLRTVSDLAAAPDGSLLIADGGHRVRRRDRAGRVRAVASGLRRVRHVAAVPGGILVTDDLRGRVLRIDARGRRRTLFGAHPLGSARLDGLRANDAGVPSGFSAVLPLPDGSLLLADDSRPRVIMIASAHPRTQALAVCRRRCPARGRVAVLATRAGTYALRVRDRVTGAVRVAQGQLPAGASTLVPGGDPGHRRQLTVTLTGADGQVTRQIRQLPAARGGAG